MLRLLANVDLLLATILVVNNLVNICIVILVSGIIDSVFTFLRFEFLFKTVLVTFLLLLFGEILPKVLAQTMPVRFAQFAARPLRVLRWIFYPLSYILVRTSSRISEKAAHKSEISLDELADAVDMTQSSSPEEHVMLSGIVNFVNTEVQEIMKPRVDITALSVTDDYETVKQTIIRSWFSRIPVYEEDIDNIRGTLYVKDLLPYINHGNEFGWQQLVRKPYFVPEHKKINDLLGDFQSNPSVPHMGRDWVLSPEFHTSRVLKKSPMEALTGGHTALGQASKGFLVKFDSGHVGMVQRLIGRPAANPKSTRWRSKNGVVEKLYTMSSPSASAMHSTVWREEVEPDSEIILQERLQHEVSKILTQAGRKTK